MTPTCRAVTDSEQKADKLIPLCPLVALLEGECFEEKCRSHTGKVALLEGTGDTEGKGAPASPPTLLQRRAFTYLSSLRIA